MAQALAKKEMEYAFPLCLNTPALQRVSRMLVDPSRIPLDAKCSSDLEGWCDGLQTLPGDSQSTAVGMKH